MKTMISLLWTLTFIEGLIGCSNPQPETYLIPDNYKGRVNVIFNQEKGVPPKYEEGRRVYQIPASGILLTQFKDEYGSIDHQYYYFDNKGNKRPLKIFQSEYNKDGTTKWVIKNQYEPGIFLDGTTGGYGNKNIRYQEFIVSDSASLDSFYAKNYQNDFMKRVQKVLNDDFHVDTLNSKEIH